MSPSSIQNERAAVKEDASNTSRFATSFVSAVTRLLWGGADCGHSSVAVAGSSDKPAREKKPEVDFGFALAREICARRELRAPAACLGELREPSV